MSKVNCKVCGMGIEIDDTIACNVCYRADYLARLEADEAYKARLSADRFDEPEIDAVFPQ